MSLTGSLARAARPAGEWRRIQTADGDHWTIVNGEVTFENGKCTGATPGKLLRHGISPS